MDRKTWLTTIIVLCIAILAIDYFFINVLFPEKKKAFLNRLFESKVEFQSSLPLPPGLRTEFPPLVYNQDDTFKESVQLCFEDADLQSQRSPRDFLNTLKKKFSVSKRLFHLENIHFLNSKKEALRIHVAPVNSEDTQLREMQVFKVLESGLPSPIGINPKEARHPSADFMKDLFRDATVTYHQLRETIILGNNTVVLTEWLNGELTKLQTPGDKKIFSCEVLNCSCL